MNKGEYLKLVEEITEEVFNKNSKILNSDDIITNNLEVAVKLSCAVNIKLLQKLGIVENFTD